MNKLTYQDCIELKEAGFQLVPCHQNYKDSFQFPDGTYRAVPKLEELIDVCGDGFINLKKVGGLWEAYSSLEDFHLGSSPIQAVKNLYIALNKK